MTFTATIPACIARRGAVVSIETALRAHASGSTRTAFGGGFQGAMATEASRLVNRWSMYPTDRCLSRLPKLPSSDIHGGRSRVSPG